MKRLLILTLCFVFGTLSIDIMAQWTSNPNLNTEVSAPRNRVYAWDFGVNPDNSITTAFLSPGDGNIEMWYNIHDTEGATIFEDGARLVASSPTILFTMFNSIAYHDAQGNMLMIYQNKRNAVEQGVFGDNFNYDVYKVSPKGELLWSEPVDLNRGKYSEDAQGSMSVAGLEDGSYVFAFADYFIVDDTYSSRICLERISADGEFLWEKTLCIEEPNVMYAYPYLVSAGDNQVILLYAKGSNQDLMLRKIDFDGSSVWNEDVKVYRGGFPSVPIWTFLSIIPDGEGGAIVGWRDDRHFTNYEKTYVSHVLSDGSYAYASGIEGEAVGYTEGMRSFEPTMLYDKDNDCLYTIRRETNMGQGVQRLMLQKMASTGELLWGPEGVEMRPDDGNLVAYFDLQFAEDGNVVAFYMVQVGGNDVAAYAHKFNKETGESMWEQDVLFTPVIDSRSELKVSPLIDGKYWVAMWEDERILEDDNIDVDWTEMPIRLYMQRINIDGSLGSIAEVTSIDSVNDEFTISVQGNSIIAPADAKIYNFNGVQVGSHNLQSGVYIVCCGNEVVKVFIK